NLANVHNEATIELGAVVNSNGFTADASQTNVSGDTTNRFGAEATSGAGGGSVGVAGSFALNIVNIETTGGIRSGATVNAGAGSVLLGAASKSESITKALPAGGGASGSSVGIGASFALSIVT